MIEIIVAAYTNAHIVQTPTPETVQPEWVKENAVWTKFLDSCPLPTRFLRSVPQVFQTASNLRKKALKDS